MSGWEAARNQLQLLTELQGLKPAVLSRARNAVSLLPLLVADSLTLAEARHYTSTDEASLHSGVSNLCWVLVVVQCLNMLVSALLLLLVARTRAVLLAKYSAADDGEKVGLSAVRTHQPAAPTVPFEFAEDSEFSSGPRAGALRPDDDADSTVELVDLRFQSAESEAGHPVS